MQKAIMIEQEDEYGTMRWSRVVVNATPREALQQYLDEIYGEQDYEPEDKNPGNEIMEDHDTNGVQTKDGEIRAYEITLSDFKK